MKGDGFVIEHISDVGVVHYLAWVPIVSVQRERVVRSLLLASS